MGAEIRRAYEDAGLHRDQFAELSDQKPKTITDVCSGGRPLSRFRAARIAKALNQIQEDVTWDADRIFDARTNADASAESAEADESAAVPAEVRRVS